MQRLSAIVLAALAIALLATGCSGAEPDTASPEDEGSAAAGDDTPAVVSAAAPDPIAVNGVGESASLDALPAALETAREADGGSHTWPDLADAEAILSAYLIRVDMDGQTALFEVRADGIPHSIYAYQRPFDSGTIVWMPTDASPAAKAMPRSDGEQTAAEAVRAAMADAFDGSAFEVSISGYRFSYVRDGELLVNLVFEPEGEFRSLEWPR